MKFSCMWCLIWGSMKRLWVMRFIIQYYMDKISFSLLIILYILVKVWEPSSSSNIPYTLRENETSHDSRWNENIYHALFHPIDSFLISWRYLKEKLMTIIFPIKNSCNSYILTCYYSVLTHIMPITMLY